MDIDARARVHAALGEPCRLAMVDELLLSDRTFQELAATAGLPGNLAAHHLAVLESAGLIERHVSEGDHRRRYISVRPERLEDLSALAQVPPGFVVFVCTHNSARSQFAAALWRRRIGSDADSAGTEPAARVHPRAIEVAAEYGLDLGRARPRSFDSLARAPELVISVCDRARESGQARVRPSLHWSIPDPVTEGSLAAFRSAFATIAARVDRFAAAAGSTQQ